MTTTDWNTATDEHILEADLLIELGLDSLPEEEQVRTVTTMTETVQEAALVRALGRLSDEQRSQFEALVQLEDADKIRSFIETAVPDFTTVIEQELILYKRVMLTGKVPIQTA